MGKKYYAHTKNGSDGKTTAPRSEWQPLEEHLKNTAELAGKFAEDFSSSAFAETAGLLHDLGKATDNFQKYLCDMAGFNSDEYESTDNNHNHSGAGAALAKSKYGDYGILFSYLVAGHHAGLPDYIGGLNPGGSLVQRLKSADDELSLVKEFKYEGFLPEKFPVPKIKFRHGDMHLWIRMLYSCLVDADCLDTERFMSPDTFKLRGHFDSISVLREKFVKFLDAKERDAKKTYVNGIRTEIRAYCKLAASEKPGIFSLTVPTGGGKTLSGMEFALEHCLKYGKKRIIYVIPYTSIIEQTAAVLKDILGKDNIIEHHSGIDPESATKASRLASENWDAPVIVTTDVQFFESLFAAKSGRCRKLHNIANSVVILDEVQLLPPELVEACTDIIRQLSDIYRATFLLSTATPPYLETLGNISHIVPDSALLGEKLKRVHYEIPSGHIKENRRCSFDEIAEELKAYKQVLCIVNRKKDALELAGFVPGSVHLSTLMCAEHRTKVIAQIKRKLLDNDPVRVISTQLVEAGVDIDFPVVYRALCGLDSIVQAAGRCNREGKLTSGKVVVFIPPRDSPKGILLKAENAAREMLTEGNIDLYSEGIFEKYFRNFYSRTEQNYSYKNYLVRDAFSMRFQFREAADKFRLINNCYVPVFVRYGRGMDLIEELKKRIEMKVPYGDVLRKLQRFLISVPENQLGLLYGMIEKIDDNLYVWNGSYDERFGAGLFDDKLKFEETYI